MNAEVLIAGAGPTGLVLALWLNAQGVGIRIIDKSVGPGTTSRATVVHARTLELYRQLDLADAVVARGHRSPAVNLWVDGKRRARLPIGEFGDAITPYPFVLIYPQDLHEQFLVDRLQERGVTVERQTELLDFAQDDAGVTAHLRRPDGSVEAVRYVYLAGCDGARSTVRKGLGAEFEGGTYQQRFYVADVLARSDTLNGEVSVSFEGSDFLLVMPYGPPGKLRLIGTIRPGRQTESDDLTFDDVAQGAVAALGLKVEMVNWFSTYHSHHRLTDHFRHKRAFLLGDAAHVHSPAGGQGMNTGIGDAINLAWKLASVLKGTADDRLLDSFEPERQAFARKLVETTDRAFSFVTKQGNLAEFVRIHIAPIFVKAVWSIEAIRELLFRIVSQTMISYPESPLSAGKSGKVSGGERLPYVRFEGGDNYGSLSTIGWQVHVYGTARPELQQWCCEHHLPLHVFSWRNEFEDAGLARDALYLLRPDSYIGLADRTGDHSAIERYFSERGLDRRGARR